MTVGPLPASASAEGSPRIPSIPAPGMLRHPVMTRADAAHEATKMNVRFEFLFSILPTFDTSSSLRVPRDYFGRQRVTNSKKPAKSTQTIWSRPSGGRTVKRHCGASQCQLGAKNGRNRQSPRQREFHAPIDRADAHDRGRGRLERKGGPLLVTPEDNRSSTSAQTAETSNEVPIVKPGAGRSLEPCR